MFVPHFGGAGANVAVLAARAGAQVALAGAVGDDPWGAWLRSRLIAEGVDVDLFSLDSATHTPAAIVTINSDGEASYQIYGDAIAAIARSLSGRRLEDAIAGHAALYFGSNTLVGSEERTVTMRARELALEHDRPVIFDPNLRLRRWSSHADAAASVNACVPGALLVRANEAEATLMTGEYDCERAAQALVKAGARLVVITRGPSGAILRGELRADVPGAAPRELRSTIGAGDALTGVLLARLGASGFYPPAVAAALGDAVAAGAAACERWGALD
jgi:fructokinase